MKIPFSDTIMPIIFFVPHEIGPCHFPSEGSGDSLVYSAFTYSVKKYSIMPTQCTTAILFILLGTKLIQLAKPIAMILRLSQTEVLVQVLFFISYSKIYEVNVLLAFGMNISKFFCFSAKNGTSTTTCGFFSDGCSFQ